MFLFIYLYFIHKFYERSILATRRRRWEDDDQLLVNENF